jgi:phosphoglycerate dehydrogenase-like enzyme
MTTKPSISIAIAPTLFDEIQMGTYLPQLSELAQVERWAGPGNPTEAWVRDAIQRNEVLITGWGTPALVDLLKDWAPDTSPLRLIAHSAGTIKYMLPKTALERGLTVVHANESLAEAVAEFTIGAILGMRRQIPLLAERYRAGKPALPYTTMRELPGSVIGIIGASAIGKRVMELLRPWKVRILLYDPYCTRETAAAYNAERVDLLTLFRESDIVSLHAPITPETTGLLRAEHFAAMKDGALFINTARGILVDHAALLNELQARPVEKRIWALLDVTDPIEPLPRDSAFFALENCVLVPHQAGNSIEARRRQGRYTAEDVLHYLKGEPLKFRVRPERWDVIA